MSVEYLTLLLLVSLAGILLLGVPFAFATGILAVVMAVTLFGSDSLLIIVSRINDMMGNQVLLAVPLFVLMGAFLERGGIADRLFHVVHVWSGNLRGGLAIGVVVTGAVLAAMVGVVGAEVVTLGLVALPAMLRRGYDKHLSLGVICASGSLGTMLPPSIVLIIYGLVANVSISELFMAATIPGLMLAGGYIIYVLAFGVVQPDKLPPAPADDRPATVRGHMALGAQLLFPIGVIVAVLGSIYAGLATPTEAAGLGATAVLIIMAFEKTLSFEAISEAVRQTARTIGPVVWIFFGANALVSVYAFAGGITFITNAMSGIALEPIGIILIMMLILFLMGMIIDWIAIAFLALPVFLPIVNSLGFDPIWFGILFCLAVQVSYLTPPFGPAAFYLKSVTPAGITLMDIYRSVIPFVAIQSCVLLLCLVFPGIVTWLPSVLAGR